MDFASLQYSVFLQSLGSAILNSLWQGFILWFLYETISASYKIASARFKNNLSTLLVALSFIWFITTFISKTISQQAFIRADFTLVLPHAQLATKSTSALQQFLSYAMSSTPYLSVAYIFLLFFLMAKLLTAYRYVYIISNKRLINPPPELNFFTQKVAKQMKIPRKITIWISNHIDVPATIGFIKPVILIPFASLNNLTNNQLEAIMLHELSHIKRNDYIINIIISVIETILFFNPFVALLSTAIKRERENCCDDFVLQYQYDPHSYATALLRLEQSRVNNLKLAIGAVSGKKQLLSRIKRITNGQVQTKQFNYGQKLLALLFITVIISSIAWLSPQGGNEIKAKVAIKAAIQNKTQASIATINAPKKVSKLKENLQPKVLKEIFIKKDVTPFKGSDMQLPFEKDEELGMNNLEPANWKDAPPPSFNFKEPGFFFNPVKMKLPPTINIQNFPFQNMAFNIDLSKMDFSNLNENLKQAYKEIDAIDFTKISKEIQESLGKIKIGSFPSKEKMQLYLEKAENLSKMRDQLRQYNSDVLKERMQKQMRRYSVNMARLAKTEKQNATAENEHTRNINTYAYTVANSLSNIHGDATGNNSVSVLGHKSMPTENKTVTITINHAPKEGLKKGKRILQFSFNGGSDEPQSEKVISIEVDDIP